MRKNNPIPTVIREAIVPPDDRAAQRAIRKVLPHLRHVAEHQRAIVEGDRDSLKITDMRDTATTLSAAPMETRMYVRNVDHQPGKIAHLRQPLPDPTPLPVRPSTNKSLLKNATEGREPTPIRPLAPVPPFHGRR
ncbi:MAG TPA: hypothetical protein VN711_01600 [Candidatus Saccharimonadales bacterium]|nr:hypothetical protein [Candidatus Saccharimonadales bacterium]